MVTFHQSLFFICHITENQVNSFHIFYNNFIGYAFILLLDDVCLYINNHYYF